MNVLSFSKHFDFQLEEAANDLSLPVELIEEFVHDFIEQAHIETKKMLEAYEEGDLAKIQAIGHLLKGASSNLRINALSDTLYKIQFCENENGLDGYHVSTVHYNYVSTVQHRQQVNASKGAELDTLDYSKLGAGDSETDDGWFSFKNGHSVLFSDMPNPTVRPGYSTVMPYMVEK